MVVLFQRWGHQCLSHSCLSRPWDKVPLLRSESELTPGWNFGNPESVTSEARSQEITELPPDSVSWDMDFGALSCQINSGTTPKPQCWRDHEETEKIPKWPQPPTGKTCKMEMTCHPCVTKYCSGAIDRMCMSVQTSYVDIKPPV